MGRTSSIEENAHTRAHTSAQNSSDFKSFRGKRIVKKMKNCWKKYEMTKLYVRVRMHVHVCVCVCFIGDDRTSLMALTFGGSF